ncbi:hypothetical protein B0H14DRAFT_3750079 [Mycena olivaceomarginata]|nr:hypothetical protein B0H14DRAFT_3750079 [Mycena olivaceomarginata]
MLPLPSFPEPPTAVSLSAARAALDESLENASSLADKITSTKASLAQIVAEAQAAIDELFREQHLVQETIAHAQAYLSPIRRLSGELLRGLFLWCFEGHPCCAWVLSAVCADWRRKALRIPLIWSKIRLFTNQSSSPDAIRLWLERSGPTVPLDIEIYLRVVQSSRQGPSRPTRTAAATSISRTPCRPLPSARTVLHAKRNAATGTASPSSRLGFTDTHVPRPAWIGLSLEPTLGPHRRVLFGPADAPLGTLRFPFRQGLRVHCGAQSITGSAPLLKEFEVSSVPAVSYPTEWRWLPSNADAGIRALQADLARLPSSQRRSCTLLTSARSPRAHPPRPHPRHHKRQQRHLNIAPSALLLRLARGAPATRQPTLEHLEDLYVGGHHLLSQLVDMLTIPQLRALGLDLDEPREPIEETISRLTRARRNPLLKTSRCRTADPPRHHSRNGTSRRGRRLVGVPRQHRRDARGAQGRRGGVRVLDSTLAAPDDSGSSPARRDSPRLRGVPKAEGALPAALPHARARGARWSGEAREMVTQGTPRAAGARMPVGIGGTGPVVRLVRLELDDCGFQLGGGRRALARGPHRQGRPRVRRATRGSVRRRADHSPPDSILTLVFLEGDDDARPTGTQMSSRAGMYVLGTTQISVFSVRMMMGRSA